MALRKKQKKEGYDLNQFPFTFLSSCGNQETKVVANISCGALLNLKKLFIQHKQGVEIKDIDINTVEKAVKIQKDGWINSQVKGGYCSPQAATESCYPDESVLKDIPIIKGKDGYYLDRTYDPWEVKSLIGLCAKGTPKAEKVKPEANDSGFSEEQTEDEKDMSKPSEKQGKSNVVGGNESSRSGKFSKAKSEEDRVSSKSGKSGGHVVTPSRPPGKLDSPKVEEQKQQVSEQKSV